jgi:hypothetical protein
MKYIHHIFRVNADKFSYHLARWLVTLLTCELNLNYNNPKNNFDTQQKLQINLRVDSASYSQRIGTHFYGGAW